jgi:hypothetical protein
MSSAVVSGLAVKCPNCGASLDLSPDTIVYVCKYCGWSGFITNEQIAVGGVLPEDVNLIKASVESFLKKRTGGNYSVSEQKLIMAPFWLIKTHDHTRYKGYRSETRTMTVGSGKYQHTQTYTVYRPVEGVIDDDLLLPLFARRHERMFALEKAEEAAQGASPVQLTQDQLKPLAKTCEFLSSSIGLDEASHWAETKVSDIHRSKVQGMCTKVFDCYTEVSIVSSQLVFYPLYTVRFQDKGRTFRMLFDAARGIVLEAEIPITKAQRAGFLVAGYGASAALAGASYALAPWITQNGMALSLVLGAIALGLAAYTTLMATRSQREVGGSKR